RDLIVTGVQTCALPISRPSVLMRLEGGELDVDGLAAFASIFVSDKGANRFANSDLDFQIKAGPVSAGGLTADTVDTALRLRDGRSEERRVGKESRWGWS